VTTSRFAFVFPGQGSQYVGMGKDLCAQFGAAKRVFAEADDALGFSLSRLCFSGPESDLKLTENTQPAILAASIAALRVLETETPVRPALVAGHSLGEYSGLVAVGADFGVVDQAKQAALGRRLPGRTSRRGVWTSTRLDTPIDGTLPHRAARILRPAGSLPAGHRGTR